jgi:hypothetical protein
VLVGFAATNIGFLGFDDLALAAYAVEDAGLAHTPLIR